MQIYHKIYLKIVPNRETYTSMSLLGDSVLPEGIYFVYRADELRNHRLRCTRRRHPPTTPQNQQDQQLNVTRTSTRLPVNSVMMNDMMDEGRFVIIRTLCRIVLLS